MPKQSKTAPVFSSLALILLLAQTTQAVSLDQISCAAQGEPITEERPADCVG